MSIVKCARIGCPHYTRSGYGGDAYSQLVPTERGTKRADGRFCWRCREGRRSHLGEKVKTGRPHTTAPGRERMIDRTPDGLCPYCLDPLPKPGKNGKTPKHCGHSACETAYHRTHARDRRRGLLVREQRVVMPRRKKR